MTRFGHNSVAAVWVHVSDAEVTFQKGRPFQNINQLFN